MRLHAFAVALTLLGVAAPVAAQYGPITPLPPTAMMAGPYGPMVVPRGQAPAELLPGGPGVIPVQAISPMPAVPSVPHVMSEGSILAEPSGGCASGACGPSCTSCCAPCCPPCLYRTGIFGEFLMLECRNSTQVYAVPQDGIGGGGTVPVGRAGAIDYDYDGGYRAGAHIALDCNSCITTTFTWFDNDNEDFVSIGAPNVLSPVTMFPGTFNAGFTAQQALAAQELDFQLVDIDYRALWRQWGHSYIGYVAGARYGHLDQNLRVTYPFNPPNGTTTVDTDIDFDGVGLHFGLEGQRQLFPCSGLAVYGKAMTSLLAGRFQYDYLQNNQFNGVEAFLTAEEDRIVPILEAELGLNWTSRDGRFIVGTGWTIASWLNMITTPELINGVQRGVFHEIARDAYDPLTFDGLVVRAEARY